MNVLTDGDETTPRLSKREWFAGQALPEVLRVQAMASVGDGESIAAAARTAVRVADAMIAALDDRSE